VRALVRKLVVPAAVVLALPAAAAAQDEPGVHVDPDSPSGKEYAIPLEGARRDASGGGTAGDSSGGEGGGGGVSSSSSAAPLFGEGITSHGSQSSGDGASNGDSSGKKTGSPAKQPARSTLASASSGSGDSAAAKTGAIALAVLLAGGGLGLLFRRGLRG
jgi:hypothetical protein